MGKSDETFPLTVAVSDVLGAIVASARHGATASCQPVRFWGSLFHEIRCNPGNPVYTRIGSNSFYKPSPYSPLVECYEERRPVVTIARRMVLTGNADPFYHVGTVLQYHGHPL